MSHSTRLASKVSAAYGASRCLLLLPPVNSARLQPAPGVALPVLLRPPAPVAAPPGTGAASTGLPAQPLNASGGQP